MGTKASAKHRSAWNYLYVRVQKIYRRLPRLTAVGAVFTTMSIFILFLAYQTDNNAFFFVGSILTAALLISCICNACLLSSITVTQTLPRHANYGTDSQIPLTIHNSSFWPKLSIGIIDTYKNQQMLTVGSVYMSVLRSHTTSNSAYVINLNKRGFHRLIRRELQSCFPFGLFRSSKRLASSGRVLVLPKIGETWQDSELSIIGEELCSAARSQHGNGDYHSLHEYRHGDNIRLINWKVSAHIDKLIVQHRQNTLDQYYSIVLDSNPSSLPTASRQFLFERAVSLAATLVCQLYRPGIDLQLIGFSPKLVRVQSKNSHFFRMHCLKALALLKPNKSYLDDLCSSQHRKLSGHIIIIKFGSKHSSRLEKIYPTATIYDIATDSLKTRFNRQASMLVEDGVS